MASSVTIKATHMVKPSEPTYIGTLPLSEWDQTGSVDHVITIYFYRSPSQDSCNSNNNQIFETLKQSLSQTLVYFYPIAGRLRRLTGNRLELNCNAVGAELIEAESTDTLPVNFSDDFSFYPTVELLSPVMDYKKPIEEIPLLVAQVTKFACGGFSISIAISHAVVDGQSALHFISEWARASRGDELGEAPWLDRSVLRAGEMTSGVKVKEVGEQIECLKEPPKLIGCVSNEEEKRKPAMSVLLTLSKEQVEKLKLMAAGDEVQPAEDDGKENSSSSCGGGGVSRRHRYSRYEVVTAHIWRCACKARGHKPEQPTSLGVCVDVRRRTNPPLPPKYFGNAIVDVVVSGNTSGSIISNPLTYVCGEIRKAIEMVDDSYVWSNIEQLKCDNDLGVYQSIQEGGEEGQFYGNPNVGTISWLTLPIYEMDFGWGKEVFMGPGDRECDGVSLILPGCKGEGSVLVALSLQVEHMGEFKKYFYEDIVDG